MEDFIERSAYYEATPLALVIGCGGLGTVVARTLGRHHPLLIVDIDSARLAQTVETLGIDGYAVSGQHCDITDPAQTKLLGDVLAKGPGVRALAHVAAVGEIAGRWQRLMEVDLIGAHLITAAAGPYMVRGGAAIFISSLASYLCPVNAQLEAALDAPLDPGFFDNVVNAFGKEPNLDEVYNLAKQGINRLAETLAIAWGPSEVRALSLSPGMIDSPMARAQGATLPSHDGTETKVPRGEKAREIPLGRQGTMLEIANVVEFLASDKASFLNGIDITVDGGHRAAWRRRGVIQR